MGRNRVCKRSALMSRRAARGSNECAPRRAQSRRAQRQRFLGIHQRHRAGGLIRALDQKPKIDNRKYDHSHSIVLGGLLEMSKQTRLTPLTSLLMRAEMRANSSKGSRTQSAVMPS